MTGNARPYHHGDLRRALLDAAAAELADSGPDGLSLRACARRAGVSPSAPAHHFGDVAGLLAALAAEGFDRLRDGLAAARGREGDAAGALHACGLAYVRFALAEPALFRLMFRRVPDAARHPGLARAGEAAYAELAGALDAALLEAGRGAADADARRLLAWAGVHGLAALAMDGLAGGAAPLAPGGPVEAALGRLSGALLGP